MQANCSQLHSPLVAADSEDASASQCVHTRLTGEGSFGDDHIQINSIPKQCAENSSSRNIRSGIRSCSHVYTVTHGFTPTTRQGNLMRLPRSLANIEVAPSQNSDISLSACKKSLPHNMSNLLCSI